MAEKSDKSPSGEYPKHKYSSLEDDPTFLPNPHVPIPRPEVEHPDPLISPVRDEPAFVMPTFSPESSSLNEQDIVYLDNTLKLRGHAIWQEGYKGLARDFEISRIPHPDKYVLNLTSKDPPRLTTKLQVDSSSNFGYDNLILPPGKGLGDDDLKTMDDVLRKTQKLLMVTPGNHDSLYINLKKGYRGILQQDLKLHIGDEAQDLNVETRKYNNFAVVCFLPKSRSFVGNFCIWVDLEKNVVSGARWFGLPMPDGDWIRPEEIEFIDAALIKHRDYSYGLQGLMERHRVSIGRSETTWWISLHPKSGIGYLEAFSIDKISGNIGLPLRGQFHR